MSTFGNSVKKELGKNTGRWLSNKIFGDGHASKHNVTIRRENERVERKNEREIIRRKREYEKEEQKQIRLEQKLERDEKNETKRFEINERKRIRNEEQILKEEELQNNKEEFENFTNYINAIQEIHQVPVDEFYWGIFEIFEDNINENFLCQYFDEIKNNETFDYEQALLNLVLSMAKIDKEKNTENYITNDEMEYYETIKENLDLDDYSNLFSSKRDILFDEAIRLIVSSQDGSTSLLQKELKIGYNRAGRLIDQMEIIGIVGSFQGSLPREVLINNLEGFLKIEENNAINSLSQAPILYRIKTIGYLKKMAFISQENDIENNMSDIEWKFLLQIAEKLKVPFDLLKISNLSGFINCSTSFIKNTYFPETIDILKNIPEIRPTQNDLNFKNQYFKAVTEPIKNYLNELITEGNGKFSEDWLDFDYDLLVSEISKKLKEKTKILKNKSTISNLFNKKKNELLKLEIEKTEKEQKKLISIQKSKNNITKYTILLNEIKEETKEEIEYFIEFWDGIWTLEYQRFLSEKETHFLSKEVLNNNTNVYFEALEVTGRLKFLEDFGSSIAFNSYKETIEIDFFININDIVPINKKTITITNKLSSKPYTATERNLLIQDYICSSTLRIAKELFLTFSIKNVIIHAIDSITNTSTGNQEDAIILSVDINKPHFNSLNLNKIDPSDAIEGFNHNMKFIKSKGFTPIQKIN